MPSWILENTLIAAILALVVMLVSRSTRLAPVIRHGLWFVVLIKLITPPLYSFDIRLPSAWLDEELAQSTTESSDTMPDFDQRSELPMETADSDPLASQRIADGSLVANQPEERPADPSVPEPPAATEQPQIAIEYPARLERSQAKDTSAEEPATPSKSAPVHDKESDLQRHGITVGNVLSLILLAGSLVTLLVQSLRLIRLRRLLGRSLPARDDLVNLVAEYSGHLGIRSPAVRFSHEISSPFICSLGRVVLVWPAAEQTPLGGAALRAVVVHELAHLARRDHWIGWLELAAGLVWWWNPLFWLVRRQLHETAELACDAWSTAICPEARHEYARALLDLAEKDVFQPAVVATFGVGDGPRQLFERRLTMILGKRVEYQMGMTGRLGILLLGLTALVGCSASWAADEVAPANTAAPRPELIDNAFEDLTLEATPQPKPLDAVKPPPAVEKAAIALDFGISSNADPKPASQEERLQRLEDKFDALLTELRALKSTPVPMREPTLDAVPAVRGKPAPPRPATAARDAYNVPGAVSPKPSPPGATPAPANFNRDELPYGATVTETPAGPVVESNWPVPFRHTLTTNRALPKGSAEGEPVVLTRATYKLPGGKADEFATFLKSHLNDDIEVRVKEGSLQVTANSADQAAISQFIRLLQTRGTSTDTKPKELPAAPAAGSPPANKPQGF